MLAPKATPLTATTLALEARWCAVTTTFTHAPPYSASLAALILLTTPARDRHTEPKGLPRAKDTRPDATVALHHTHSQPLHSVAHYSFQGPAYEEVQRNAHELPRDVRTYRRQVVPTLRGKEATGMRAKNAAIIASWCPHVP